MAAYQALEGGTVFADPLALRILGDNAEEAIALAKERPERRGLRFLVAMPHSNAIARPRSTPELESDRQRVDVDRGPP
jgi:hypothetical protein